jgi:tetratricopeptide (TPR) repeat protein
VLASNGSLAAGQLRAQNVYVGGSPSVPKAVPLTLAPPLGLRDPALPLRGRDMLLAALESALSGAPDGRLHVLAGMGGCGKTSLALELAWRRQDKGCQVWWVDARQSATLEAGLRAVARQAGADDEELRAGDAADVLWARLSRYERPWLLVVDNADEPALLDGPGRLRSGTGWIRPRTAAAQGSVLVTTRDAAPGAWGGTSVLHPVRPLAGDDLGDAAQILLDHARGRAGSADDARRLAERLGGLPLALRLAGSYLAEVNETPRAFRAPDMPDTFAAYQAALDRGVQTVDPENTIGQTWAMSVSLLEERGELLARPLLTLIATFADAPLPYTLLLTPARLAGAGELAGPDGPGLWRLLTSLAGLGLIDLPLDSAALGTLPTLRIHPLVRDTSRSDTALPTAVQVLHSAVYAAETGIPEDPGHWEDWRLLQPHALHLFHRAAGPTLPEDVRLKAAGTANLAVRYLATRGLYRQARTEFEAVLAVQRESLGDTHQDTLAARHNLAGVLHDQGELDKARSEFEAILAARRDAQGDTHPDTLTARHGLAGVLHTQGELDKARSEFEAILAIRRETLGDTHPTILTTRHELAGVLNTLGEQDRARAELEAILAIRRKTLGHTHPTTLTTRHNLAGVLHDQGELHQARTEFETVLAFRRETLGDTHPHTLVTRHELARVLHTQGELGKARTEFEAVLTVERETQGHTHPDTLVTRHNLAEVLHDQGELEEAHTELEAILAIRRETLGLIHPRTLTTRHNLARVLHAQGELDQARTEFEAVLAIQRQTLGETHPHTESTRRALDSFD